MYETLDDPRTLDESLLSVDFLREPYETLDRLRESARR